jgi:hypothetical protein
MLTTSRFLGTSHAHITLLMQQFPNIQQMVLKATDFALKGAPLRHIELQCYTNEDKFRTLLARSLHILNLVPHKYLTFCLGMDATHFSRLLGWVKI